MTGFEYAAAGLMIQEDKTILSVLYGILPLNAYLLDDSRVLQCVTADGNEIPFVMSGNRVDFGTTLEIRDTLILA